MKIKKAFTLIEVLITIVIIGIILSMVTALGQGFSDRIRFANTKETFVSAIQNIVQEAATTNAVRVMTGVVHYGYLSVAVTPGTGVGIVWTYASGDLVAPVIRQLPIEHGIISTSGFSMQLTPYALGCVIGSGDTVRLVSDANVKLFACYHIDASTCKIQEISCP